MVVAAAKAVSVEAGRDPADATVDGGSKRSANAKQSAATSATGTPTGTGSAAAGPATAAGAPEPGLAQALAAALWESEPASTGPAPLPMTVPALMDDSELGYSQPTPEELAAMAAFDIPVETSVMAKAKKAARSSRETPPAWVTERLDELLRLQQRQQDHVEKLYAENRTLRAGELASALAPIMLGLTKLFDQMAMLTATDGPDSSAALLQKQLLQVLEHAGSAEMFAPAAGSRFDSRRQRGVGTVDTDDPDLDGRVSATVRPGFVHLDGTVVRVAEVEVLRFRAEKIAAGPKAVGT